MAPGPRLAAKGNALRRAAGNLLVVSVARGSSGSGAFEVGDISKSAGTARLATFTLDAEREDAVSGGYQDVAIFSVPVTGSGSGTIQVANGPSGAWRNISVVEYSRANVSTRSVAGTNEADGSGTVTITPDAAFNQLAKWEDGSSDQVGAPEDRIVSAGTTDAATRTTMAPGTPAAR